MQLRSDTTGPGSARSVYILIFIATTLLSLAAAAQPANDVCTGALRIPSTGPFPYTTAPVDITAADVTNSGDPAMSCMVNSATRRLWYEFRAPETGVYRIGSCTGAGPVGGRSDTVLAIYDGTPGCASSTSLPMLACDEDTIMAAGVTASCLQRSSLHVLLNADQTYFILIASGGAITTTITSADTLSFTIDKMGPLAPNDVCAGAVPLAPPAPDGITLSPVVNMERALEASDPNATSCGSQNTRGLWYTFAPTTTATYRIDACTENALVNGNSDTTVSVFTSSDGNCTGAMTPMLINGAQACSSATCGNHGSVTGTFNAGTTYYVLLQQSDDQVNPPGLYDGQLRIVGPRSNDTCSSAAPITLGQKVTGWTVSNNDHQLDGGLGQYMDAGIASSAPGRDVVYRFDVPATGAYTLRATPSATATNTVLYVANTCTTASLMVPSVLAASNKGSGAEELTCMALTQGDTLYAYVDEHNSTLSTGADFTFEVSSCLVEQEPNDLPATANALQCGITGGINSTTDVDYYSLGSPAAGARAFALVDGYASNGSGVDLRVTSATATLEFDNSDNDTVFGANAPNVAGTPLVGGPAYLRVNHPFSGASEPYRLYSVVQTGSPSAELEPNDSPTTAMAAAGNYFSGTLPYAGLTGGSPDVDYYAFTATAGELLMLNLDGDPDRAPTGANLPAFNGRVDLLSSAGEILFTVNDPSSSSTTTPFNTLDAGSPFSPGEALLFTAPTTGVYYVRVTPGANSSNFGWGDYLLSISRDCRPGDGIVAPTSVGAFSPTTGGTVGGTAITVTGAGFVDGARVRIGGNFAPVTTFVNSGTVTALTPAGTAGNATVEVVNPGLQAAASSTPFVYVESPTITQVTPATGTTLGGTPFVIQGTQFVGTGITVTFGGVVVPVTVDSATQLSGVTPAHAAGAVDVTVDGQFGAFTKTNAFTYLPPPSLVSVSPQAGPTAGGNTVTLNGSGFTALTEIRVDGVLVPQNASGSASQLFFTAPSHTAGPVSIQLTNSDGQTVTVAGAYTFIAPPDITAINPTIGDTFGNEVVTLTGSNFDATATVTFDGLSATNVTVTGGTSITATTPGHSTGAVVVTVTNADGQTDTIGFIYRSNLPPPVLTSIAPASGGTAGGTVVTLTGSAFLSGAEVFFDGVAATNVQFVSATQLLATAPANSYGPADVTVSNPDNQTATLTGAFLYVAPAPTLAASAVSPASGWATTTTALTVSGDELMAGATVDLGGAPCTNVVRVSKTTLTCTAQPHAAGFVTLTVNNPDGQSVSRANAFEYVPAPTIAAISPNHGSTLGGATVVITGTGFRTGANVRFGALAATYVSVDSATQLTVTAPAQGVGTVSITVTNSDNQLVTAPNAFTYYAPPSLTGIAPNVGYSSGGTSVTLTGTAFRPGAVVRFVVGAASVDGIITNISATSISAITPAQLAGFADVVVVNSDGQLSTLTAGFRFVPAPVVTAVSPSHGPSAGGTAITVTGSNFFAGAVVRIGGTPAYGITVDPNGQQLTALTTGHGAGTFDVEVTNPDGQKSALANAFTYDAAPTVSAVSPNFGGISGGAQVTVSGTGFLQGATVKFGLTPCTVTQLTATSITVTTPAHAAGTVSVSVANPDGQSALLPAAYTFLAAPALSSLNPTTGPTVGGTRVTLTGSDFAAGTTVTFDGVPATDVTVLNATTIEVLTPAHAAGAVDVTITRPDSRAASITNGFTYAPVSPVISELAPATGTTEGGTTVTLSGSGFSAGAQVFFGTTPATSLIVVSSTLIRAVTPASPAGTVSIAVSNPDGEQGSLSNAFTFTRPAPLTEGRLTDGGTGTVSGVDPNDPGVAPTPASCGCSAGNGAPWLFVFALLALQLVRRRRA